VLSNIEWTLTIHEEKKISSQVFLIFDLEEEEEEISVLLL
jgi:hypothetical protein